MPNIFQTPIIHTMREEATLFLQWADSQGIQLHHESTKHRVDSDSLDVYLHAVINVQMAGMHFTNCHHFLQTFVFNLIGDRPICFASPTTKSLGIAPVTITNRQLLRYIKHRGSNV